MRILPKTLILMRDRIRMLRVVSWMKILFSRRSLEKKYICKSGLRYEPNPKIALKRLKNLFSHTPLLFEIYSAFRKKKILRIFDHAAFAGVWKKFQNVLPRRFFCGQNFDKNFHLAQIISLIIITYFIKTFYHPHNFCHFATKFCFWPKKVPAHHIKVYAIFSITQRLYVR